MAPIQLDVDFHVPVLRPSQGQLVTVIGGPPLQSLRAELLVLALKKSDAEEWQLPAKIAAFDAEVADGALAELAVEADFSGKPASSTDLVRVAGAKVKRIVLYGIGDGEEKNIAKAAAFAVSKATGKASSVALYVDVDTAQSVATITEAANVAAYVDERFKGTKSEKPKKSNDPPKELVIVGLPDLPQDQLSRGHAIAAGVITTKEVVTAPANNLTPEGLADAARLVAGETNLAIDVLGREECKKLGMGCYLAVTQGSIREPQFIHMTYTPEGDVKKKIAFVGKAVTFDSGGYNLKVGAGSMIELMKWDMGGSGSVLGAAAAIGRIKPKGVQIHFIMPACENMISERAIHPGDILTASNGKTVEVINTDAEGRLCLADALVFAENLGDVDAIIDCATLTGAIITALGSDVAGFWTPSDQLADALMDASKKGNENLWRMPLVESYDEHLKSKCADFRNLGTRGGSSIQAALFLKKFVNIDNWAHLDIAGTAWGENGATGFGVKTLLNYAEFVSQ